MEPKQTKLFIDTLIYDIDTIDYLQEYGRLKETMPILERILSSIESFRSQWIGSGGGSEAVFNEGFLKRRSLSKMKIVDLRNAMKEIYIKTRSEAEEDLKKIEYDSWIEDIKTWVYLNIKLLKKITKSSLQKKYENILIVCVLACIGIGLMFFVFWKIYTQSWGLAGHFYRGMNFEELVATKISRTIDFNGASQMNSKTPRENYSVRYEGFVLAPKDGKYAFALMVDDGGRLFIDEKPIASGWEDQHPKEYGGEMYLSKGFHSIRVEYYNHTGDVTLKLFWKPENEKKIILPFKYLRQTKSE